MYMPKYNSKWKSARMPIYIYGCFLKKRDCILLEMKGMFLTKVLFCRKGGFFFN